MADVTRWHLIVDVVGDGTDPRKLAAQLLAGRRPDARVVDMVPDLVAHPDVPPRPEGVTPLPSAEAVYVVFDDPGGGLVLERPAFLWARPVYDAPEPWVDGIVLRQGPATFERIEFGGQAHHYGTVSTRPPETVLERLQTLRDSVAGADVPPHPRHTVGGYPSSTRPASDLAPPPRGPAPGAAVPPEFKAAEDTPEIRCTWNATCQSFSTFVTVVDGHRLAVCSRCIDAAVRRGYANAGRLTDPAHRDLWDRGG